MLEKEKKNMPMLKISVRLHCWVEHEKMGVKVKRNFKQELLHWKQDNVNSNLSSYNWWTDNKYWKFTITWKWVNYEIHH